MPKCRVVIVGAGFGGLTAAKGLGGSDFDVVVLDSANHHLFQPLLYQVATAMLSPADIAVPVRHVLHRYQNIRVKMLEVTGVDVGARQVLTKSRPEPYDHLILATGARSHYFGNPWEAFAPSLKTLEDARAIRKRILTAFERAELSDDGAPDELTFIIIGGGPTGVELAGAIVELAHQTVVKDFRVAEMIKSRIILIEAGPRLLPTFSNDSSHEAHRALTQMGVEIRLGERVTGIDVRGVALGDTIICSRTVIWAAGVSATPVAEWLGADCDRSGRVRVTPTLTLPEHPEIFVIGDVAHTLDKFGQPLPGVAPVAMQEGRYVAERILGKTSQEFSYRDKGSLATIGRHRAVAEIGTIHLRGSIAWWAWTLVHVYYLIGFRNRIVVLLEWAWAYMTRTRGARLISHEP